MTTKETPMTGGLEMKRNRRLLRIWLGSAVAFGSLVLVSGASAMLGPDGGGVTTTKPAPVGGGFDWGFVAIGVAVILVAAAAVALTQVARNRGRVVASA
jgi:hypothetical protein